MIDFEQHKNFIEEFIEQYYRWRIAWWLIAILTQRPIIQTIRCY